LRNSLRSLREKIKIMKQKVIIWISVVLLLVVVAFMVKDFFYKPANLNSNPYDYRMDNLKKIDPSKVCYTEINKIKPDIEQIHGIAIDKSDNIYIAGKGKVVIFDSQLALKSSFKIDNEAKCVGVGEDGNIYLGIQDHIEVFEPNGKLINSWNAVNSKSVITSIAISEKYVYIADAGNRIVYQYKKDGDLVKEIGKKNPEKGILGFVIPSPYFDLLIGREGELWVVNPGRHALESYNENGDQVSSWAKASMGIDGFCGCCNPSNIAMLSDGSFVTSEKAIERVKVHLPNGDFKCVVATPDGFEEGTKGIDLGVDSKDRIYVLDPIKNIVRVFEHK